MLLFASYLQNPNQPPIANAALWIQESTIRFAGPRSELPAEALQDSEKYELEDAALFPGLVNAHCHLELSSLQDFPYPGDFVSWVRQIITTKNQGDPEAQRHALSQGALLSLLGGTTTVGDHISFNGDLEALFGSPLRGRAFIEVLGVVPEVAEDILEAAENLTQAFQNAGSLWQINPSPHSVHALEPQVLEKLMAAPHSLFSIHLAESDAEQEYFENNRGPMHQLICERGNPLNHSFASAIQELEGRGLLNEKVLVVHGNYLSVPELAKCASRGISIVHCPLSHQYFGHHPFPMQEALEAGVNLALGTDSLASAASLSMLEVLRQTEKNFPHLKRENILHMATLGGAKALQMESKIGSVVAGKKADLLGVRIEKVQSPLNALFTAEQVDFLMINGRMLVG